MRSENDGHAALELECFLPYRLSVVSNRISQTIARTYGQRFGITITEWRIIAILGRYSGLSANVVAERTAMDKVAVSRALSRLLSRGLLQREPHNDDRRRSVLELSLAGYCVYNQVVPLALKYEQSLLDCLDANEQAALEKILVKLETATTA